MTEKINKIANENAKTTQLMDRIHAEIIFETPSMSKDYLNSINYHDFKKLLCLINGLERDISKPNRNLDGNGVIKSIKSDDDSDGITVYLPPESSIREALLEESFDLCKKIDDPEAAGLALGMSIVAIHPFQDGNGRTSRLVYGLLSHGYDGSKECKDFYNSILANTDGRKVIDLNPNDRTGLDLDEKYNASTLNIIKANKYIGSQVPSSINYIFNEDDVLSDPAELVLSQKITPDQRNRLYHILKDTVFRMSPILEALPKDIIEQSIDKEARDKYKISVVNGRSLFSKCNGSDIDALVRCYDSNKRDYIKLIVDLLSSDDSAAKIKEMYKSHIT